MLLKALVCLRINQYARRIALCITVRRLLEIVGNPANRPVLVHCPVEPGRSVLLASTFQIEIVNWDIESTRRTVGPLHWCGDFPPDQAEARYLLSYVGDRPKVTLVSPEE